MDLSTGKESEWRTETFSKHQHTSVNKNCNLRRGQLFLTPNEGGTKVSIVTSSITCVTSQICAFRFTLLVSVFAKASYFFFVVFRGYIGRRSFRSQKSRGVTQKRRLHLKQNKMASELLRKVLLNYNSVNSNQGQDPGNAHSNGVPNGYAGDTTDGSGQDATTQVCIFSAMIGKSICKWFEQEHKCAVVMQFSLSFPPSLPLSLSLSHTHTHTTAKNRIRKLVSDVFVSGGTHLCEVDGL